MKPLRIALRVVFYKENDAWIAHCLEFDLLGDGRTKREALAQLWRAIAVQIKASEQYASTTNLFTPADGQYFRMFAAGKDVTVSSMPLKRNERANLTIESVLAREYSASADANSKLSVA